MVKFSHFLCYTAYFLGFDNGDGKPSKAGNILWSITRAYSTMVFIICTVTMTAEKIFAIEFKKAITGKKPKKDFNGDGKSNVIWQNSTTGDVAILQMDGITIKGADFVKPKAGAASVMAPLKEHRSGADSWDMNTSGDYNGDGINDMLWQDGSTGDVYMWFMDGNTISSGGYVEQGVPSQWSIYKRKSATGRGRHEGGLPSPASLLQ
ncbi:MAG: VCBS repeat-containing protein [Magnetococcales bacterium]|nr:VCBS repeat-containing protein [Nitrospirota bacterium]